MFSFSIFDEDCGFERVNMKNPKLRLGARGIVRKGNKIGVFYKKNMNQYKLPGGGIDLNESPIDAFEREVLEETGCSVKNIELVGVVNEIKSQGNFVQTSFVYICDFDKQSAEMNLTEKEIAEGGEFFWSESNDVLDLMEKSIPLLKSGCGDENVYSTTFVSVRDKKILQIYINNLKN